MKTPDGETVFGFDDGAWVNLSIESGWIFLQARNRITSVEATFEAPEARRLARKLYEFARYLEAKGR